MEHANMTLTARTPDDLLAMVPVVLGFVPEDSLVMLTFGAGRTFHARVDLPPSLHDVDQVIEALLEPAVRHRVERVVFLAYSGDVAWAGEVTGRVRKAFRRRGIGVIGRIAADGSRWWALPEETGDPGTPYDVSAHPFAAQAVLHGLVTHRSRDELSATLAPDPGAVAAVERALSTRPELLDEHAVAEAAWAAAFVRRCVAGGVRPDPEETARLLAGLLHPGVRDDAWTTMSRAEAIPFVEFWTDVARRTPASHLAAPAAILGFAAWLAGHGALAWCAADRSREADPDNPLVRLLARSLAGAVPPAAWDEMAGRGPGRPA
jgi:uncharacterized protein DUF4192